MKLMTLSFAGLMAAMTLVPTAATAQPGPRHGWDDRRDDRRGWDDRRDDRRGYEDRRGWRGDRGYRGDRGWRSDRGWRGDRYAWNGYRGARTQTVCRWVDGYYGPERRCFRVRR